MIRRFGRLYSLRLIALVAMVLLEVVELILVNQGVKSGQTPFDGQMTSSVL